MKILAVRLRSLFDLLDGHFQSEPFQLANQPPFWQSILGHFAQLAPHPLSRQTVLC
jgi:hypothetical protein